MAANSLTENLTVANSPIIIQENTAGLTIPVKSKDLIYPCTIWVSPLPGSTISVATSFDGKTQTAWTPGPVTAEASQLFTSCPGEITFTLVSGTGGTVGIT